MSGIQPVKVGQLVCHAEPGPGRGARAGPGCPGDLVSWRHPTHLLGEEEALVPVGPVGRLAVGVPVTPVSEGSSTRELIRPEEEAIIHQMAANPTCFSGSHGRT